MALITTIWGYRATGQSAENIDQVFSQGNAYFETGEYQRAIESYTSLLTSGHSEFALHYNLGAAYLAQEQIGRALAQFYQARLYAPRDSELERNIQVIRAIRIDETGEKGVLESIATMTEDIVTVLEFTLLLGLIWGIGCSIAWYNLFRFGHMAHTRRVLMVCWIVFTIGLTLFGLRLVYNSVLLRAIVITEVASIRSGPNDNYPEIYELHAATEMRLATTDGEWHRFVLSDGRQGWIRSTDLEVIP
jgi:tetratricopeptide (TPR) repeat protein